MRIALFITCLTDAYAPRAGIATVKVLEHLGHEVVFPAEQTCCGQPMLNNGFREEARALARRWCDAFAPYEHVVTPSGSCAAMVRRHFPDLLDDDEVRALAARTRTFAELLVDVLDVDLAALGARWDGTVACHASCHLREIGGSGPEARLLDDVGGLDAQPLPHAEQCCGFGGTFALRFPATSTALAADKVAALGGRGPRVLVSSDTGCAMHLAGACRRSGGEVAIRSVPEIVAEALGLLTRTGSSRGADA